MVGVAQLRGMAMVGRRGRITKFQVKEFDKWETVLRYTMVGRQVV